jgi:hypothetical protein
VVDVLIVDDQRPFRTVPRTVVGLVAGWRVAAEPGTTVVVLSSYAVDDLPADATDCGAAAYFHEEGPDACAAAGPRVPGRRTCGISTAAGRSPRDLGRVAAPTAEHHRPFTRRPSAARRTSGPPGLGRQARTRRRTGGSVTHSRGRP